MADILVLGDEAVALGAIDAAMESGINMIDTAPIYGLGVSETVVGKAIHGRRDKVILATKCGLIKRGNRINVDLSGTSICLLYTSPSPRDRTRSRMPSSA